MSRQTVSKKFNTMKEELGLIVEKDDVYELITLELTSIALIPKETINLLLDVFNDYTISTYVYLFSRYMANNQKGYICLLKHIKAQIGFNINNNHNNEQIHNIFSVLQSIGLLQYHIINEGSRKYYFIDKVCLVVKK